MEGLALLWVVRAWSVSQGARVLVRKGCEAGLGWSLPSKSLISKLMKETSRGHREHYSARKGDMETVVPASTAQLFMGTVVHPLSLTHDRTYHKLIRDVSLLFPPPSRHGSHFGRLGTCRRISSEDKLTGPSVLHT